jgi:hypothetical protein
MGDFWEGAVSKPEVKCYPLSGLSCPMVVGYATFVRPINHPDKVNVTGDGIVPVRTSPVVGLIEGGFETENTRYIFVKEPD